MVVAGDEVELRFAVREPPERWLLEDEDVPETPLHDAVIELLMLLLKYRMELEGRDALVCSNLGCRWDPQDARVGMDPDVVLVEPRPEAGERLSTLRSWEHGAPRLAVEVVSTHRPDKDYLDAPARAARLGVEELWVYDPDRLGPDTTGGPFLLQVWVAQSAQRQMVRIQAGDGPAFSPLLGAWLRATNEPTRLRIFEDRGGRRPWPTAWEAEAERADREAERADREAERADREAERAEAAKAEIARLKALLDKPE